MTSQGKLTAMLMFACLTCTGGSGHAAELLSKPELNRMGLQRFWQTTVPLANGEVVERVELLDDNVYLITNANRAYAVHARTGILRWGAPIGEPGQTVRGPTHSDQDVLFTAPATVKVLNRRTGEPKGEPRKLRGAIIEVVHDTATISIGQAHGVRPEDMLNVVRLNEYGDPVGEPLAQLRITVVEPRQAKGRLIRKSRTIQIRSGDRVAADVILPLESVTLPFAASSPAIASSKDLFVGAANQRFYSLNLLRGYRNWQLMTPKTLSATPVLRNESLVRGADGQASIRDIDEDPEAGGRRRQVLYFGGQDGRIVSVLLHGSLDREKNWVYETEGPIFMDIVVAPQHVYAASNDRSLYCLSRLTGERVWQKRFDNPAETPPQLLADQVYQEVPNEGLFVLDAATGETRWRFPEGGRCLAQFDKDVFLFHNLGRNELVRLEAETGAQKSTVATGGADFAAASQDDQLILLMTRLGQMMCVRPMNAPTLKPAELAEVLRNDRKVQALARLTAEERAKAQAKSAGPVETKPKVDLSFLDEENWLSSRSKLKPVGGSGLVEVGEPATETEDNAGDEADDSDEEEAEEDDDEWGDEDDWADEDEAEDDEEGEDDGWDDDEDDWDEED